MNAQVVISALAGLALFSGCFSPAPDTLGSGGIAVSAFEIVCPFGGSIMAPDGVCGHALGPTAERNREAQVAAHPTDPMTVLATWRVGEFDRGPRIFAAMTSDGGTSWNVRPLQDPAISGPEKSAAGYHYAYDSVAAFSPRGTAFVLYGGENPHERLTEARLLDRLTLAVSRDAGQTWRFHRVFEFPAGTFGPDYMDLAVAPDTGRIYVVAQQFAGASPACSVAPCSVPQGVWIWVSDDEGATWSRPQPVMQTLPYLDSHIFPRVTAGRDGIVVVTTIRAALGTGAFFQGAFATISRDGGNSFEEPRRVMDYMPGMSLVGDPAAITRSAEGKPVLHLLYSVPSGLAHRLSMDTGRSWQDLGILALIPEGADPAWSVAAPGRGGSVLILQRYGRQEPAVFGASLHRIPLDGTMETFRLANSTGFAGNYQGGDEYGGLAAAADGSVWAVWSDPRFGANERVFVVRAR